MYCVFNENRKGAFSGSVHIRQLKETEDGERSSMLRDNKAIIEVVADNHYIARGTNGEVIAISDIFVNVLARVKHAQRTATIDVVMDDETMSLESYYEMSAPKIYRLQYSTSVKHGELIAMSIFSKGKASDTVFYETIEDSLNYIAEVQVGDSYYYVATSNRRVLDEARERALGMEYYEASDKERYFTQLKDDIQAMRRKQDSEVVAYE